MTIKIGINGMGRIGRMVVRSIVESKNKNLKINHINNRSNSETTSKLIKYDSICLLYTSPSPRDQRGSRMPSSA